MKRRYRRLEKAAYTVTDAVDKVIQQRNAGTPEPPKWKAKGGSKGDGKGKSKGNGKGKGKEKGQVEWRGFCSYCGKKGHGPVDSWT